MPTQSESPVAVSGTPSKSLAIAAQAAPPTAAGDRSSWRSALPSPPRLSPSGGSTSLNGLPDIGDPFDVAAFRAFRIPDDQNAFAFLRRAHEKLTPIRWGEGPYPDAPKFSWSIANPKHRGSGPGRTARRSNCFCRGPTNPTLRTRPENPQPTWFGRLDLVGISRGEQATRERRHGGRLGLLSRGPPHDHSHAGGGEARFSVIPPGGRTLAAATARRLGGGSEDHDPPTSYRPG